MLGFPRAALHCGADYAQTGDFCGHTDPLEDYEAIEAGYDLSVLSNGGDVTEGALKTALSMHPTIARGVPRQPKPASYFIPWPYLVGTFDAGSTGVIFTHR